MPALSVLLLLLLILGFTQKSVAVLSSLRMGKRQAGLGGAVGEPWGRRAPRVWGSLLSEEMLLPKQLL